MYRLFILFGLIILVRTHAFPENKTKAESLLQTIKTTTNDSLKAARYLDLSRLYWDDSLELCNNYAMEGLKIARKIHSGYLKYHACRNLGHAFMGGGDLIKSYYYCKQGFKEAKLLRDDKKIADIVVE
ncbi:MAG: hypothetical protein WCL00_00390 [Bacteroidota bacterium]